MFNFVNKADQYDYLLNNKERANIIVSKYIDWCQESFNNKQIAEAKFLVDWLIDEGYIK